MNSYIKILLSSLITLFPVINPLGTAFILNPFFENLSKNDQKKIAKKVAIYAFSLCFVTLLAGQYILELFGVSVPVVQLAGGILIGKMGWDLTKDDDKQPKAELASSNSFDHLKNKLFYPITFPMTTGAGTISVLLTLSAHNKGTTYVHSLINMSAILIAVIAMCVLIYIFYSSTTRITNRWGRTERNVVNKITAFLIFAYGLEIASNGMFNLIKSFGQ
ncbi:MAG: MarC family protein [Spirochaetales bacterium]|jgi:multiple antibiotic resistance protein